MRPLTFNQVAALAERRFLYLLECERLHRTDPSHHGLNEAGLRFLQHALKANAAYLIELGMNRRLEALLVSAEWRRTVGPP